MVCPHCGTLNPEDRSACFRCCHSLARNSGNENNCRWHPNRPRAAGCGVCGAPICEECAIRVEDVAYCPNCAAVPGEDRLPEKTEPFLSPDEMLSYHGASFLWRTAACVVDGFLIGAGAMTLALLYWVLSGTLPDLTGGTTGTYAYWGMVLLGAGIFLVTGLVSSGQTPGCAACDLIVVHRDGTAVSVSTAAARYLASLVSIACFGIGYLWVLWDPDNQAWHDKAVGTLVLRRND